MIVMSGVVDAQVELCMADYDATAAAEPDPLLRRAMQAKRSQVEALVRRRTEEELGKAVLAMLDPDEETTN